MKINLEKFYTPKEAIAFLPTKAKSEDIKRQMLLRFIRDGRIESVNLGGDKKPRYVIQGKNLLKYRDAQMKKGSYQTK